MLQCTSDQRAEFVIVQHSAFCDFGKDQFFIDKNLKGTCGEELARDSLQHEASHYQVYAILGIHESTDKTNVETDLRDLSKTFTKGPG